MCQRTIGALLLMLAAAATGVAQENRWRAFLGVSYRQFDDVEADGFTFRNSGNAMVDGGPFGIQNFSVLPGLADGSGVTADYVTFNGGDTDGDTTGSPMLGVAYMLGHSDHLELSLVMHFQQFEIDAGGGGFDSTASPGVLDVAHYNYLVENEHVLAPPVGGPFAGFSPGTSAAATALDFDMDLFVVDLGLQVMTRTSPVRVGIAAGPSLNITDTDSSVVESGRWNRVHGTGDPGMYRRSERDSESDVLLGCYVSVSVEVGLTERLSLRVAYRYDDVSGTAGTSQAKLDLDGHTGIIALVYRF